MHSTSTGILTKAVLIAGFILLSLASIPARATDPADISVALKTLPLLTNKFTNPTTAIIYDSANSESRSDAEAIKTALENSTDAPGDLHLVPLLVDINETSKLRGLQLAFIARGIAATQFATTANATANAGILTICTDLNGVKNNSCILGVASKPKVEVYYSPIAAEKAKISFASAFTMLAKQVGSM